MVALICIRYSLQVATHPNVYDYDMRSTTLMLCYKASLLYGGHWRAACPLYLVFKKRYYSYTAVDLYYTEVLCIGHQQL